MVKSQITLKHIQPTQIHSIFHSMVESSFHPSRQPAGMSVGGKHQHLEQKYHILFLVNPLFSPLLKIFHKPEFQVSDLYQAIVSMQLTKG